MTNAILTELLAACRAVGNLRNRLLDGEDVGEFVTEEYLENLEVTLVDNAARELGISWDEVNDWICENI